MNETATELQQHHNTNECDCNSSQTWGDLSVFQRVMRQWADLHPYNAVHVFRFEGQADIDKLADSIERAWQALDFGLVSIRKHQYSFSCPQGQRPEIEVIEAGDNPAQAINAHLTDQINRHFPTQDYSPIRFSVIQEATCHHLCITYDHWIGDGVAIRLLLRSLICGYCGTHECGSDSNSQSVDDERFVADAKVSFYPPTYRKAYRNYFSNNIKRFFQWWRGILANNVTILVPPREKESMYAEYISQDFSSEALQNMLACAKQHSVTVHDVFLAAITRACMPYMPQHLVRRKRRQMGIGSIVNARGLADVHVENAIGVYLGYFITHSRADQADTLGGLAQVIAKKTSRIKNDKIYLNTAIGMKIQCLLWPIIPQFAKARFLRNSLPLSAGITNSYVKDAWMTNLHDSSQRRLLSYYRAAPTGPIIPISFAPTTMAGSLHMGITWRPSCFDRETIEKITANIENDLLCTGSPDNRQ